MTIFSRALPVFFLLASAPAFAAEVPPSFADLVEKLTPAVVNISTTQKVKGGMQGNTLELPDGTEMPEEFRHFFEQFGKRQKGQNDEENGGQDTPEDHEVTSLGSGFIIDEAGYVATNNHVIADADQVEVTLSDDTKLKAKIIGRDTKTDLALLKVEAGKKLPFVPLGDSDVSRVGDWVIAIGNPFGLGGTVTAGIISARARNINAGPFDDFIQTDAAINRGNSGGPMFNMKGEVIGINTAIFSPSGGSVGIGFAVPMAMAKPVFAQLRASGHIDRGWLGVKIQPVTDEIADSVGLKKTGGALVMEVTKDSPGQKAGILPGDIITRFDGKEIKEMRALPRIVAETKIGKLVTVELWRKNQVKQVQVTLGQLKETDKAENENGEDEEGGAPLSPVASKDMLGMTLVTVSPEARQKYGLKSDVQGVAITKLKPGSEALKRGLHTGDIITQIGDTPITSLKDVSDALAASVKAGHKFILAHVQRGATTNFVTLPVEDKVEKK